MGGRFPLTTDRIRAIAGNDVQGGGPQPRLHRTHDAGARLPRVLLVLSALAVSDQAPRVVVSFGVLLDSRLFGVLIAIVMGVILVYKEIEKKTIYTIVPKAGAPVRDHPRQVPWGCWRYWSSRWGGSRSSGS